MTQRYIVVFFYFLFLSIIFFGFSKVILNMTLGRPPDSAPLDTKKENFFMIVPLVILAVVLFFSGVFVPGSLYGLIDEASALLGGR